MTQFYAKGKQRKMQKKKLPSFQLSILAVMIWIKLSSSIIHYMKRERRSKKNGSSEYCHAIRCGKIITNTEIWLFTIESTWRVDIFPIWDDTTKQTSHASRAQHHSKLKCTTSIAERRMSSALCAVCRMSILNGMTENEKKNCIYAHTKKMHNSSESARKEGKRNVWKIK